MHSSALARFVAGTMGRGYWVQSVAFSANAGGSNPTLLPHACGGWLAGLTTAGAAAQSRDRPTADVPMSSGVVPVGQVAKLLSGAVGIVAMLACITGGSEAQVVGRSGELLSGTVATADGVRTYLVYLPTGYRADSPLPLVVAFHGGGGYATDMARASGLSRFAEPQNYVAVYPQGLQETWNTDEHDGSFVERSQADDVGFVGAILTQMKTRFVVDASRVYAAGFSKGGMFAYHVACKLPGVFAAAASVSGPMVTNTCAPSATLSVLHIHGTADENAPWRGGRGLFTDPRNAWPAPIDGLKAWADQDRCDAAAAARSLAPGWTCSEFAHCGAGAAVSYCLVDGGGHEWPPAAPGIIAAFFRQHAL
jgi:polyhydroxybutyrate depolymerase